ARELGGICLNEVDGSHLDEVTKIPLGVDRLAEGDRDGDAPREGGVGLLVEGVHRFFEPVDVVIRELSSPRFGNVERPGAVHVGHELDVRTDGSSNLRHPLEVLARIRSTELDLDGVESASDELAG